MAELKDLVIGKLDGGDKKAVIRGSQRLRGVVLVGQPGAGKSTLFNQMALQSAENGEAILMVDPHQSIVQFLEHCPKHRRDDIRVLSLTAAASPLLPLLDITERADEFSNVANLLVASWRAQHGATSIGPRASSMLTHALKLINPDALSPIELLSALLDSGYRARRMGVTDHRFEVDFPLRLYWGSMHGALGPRVTAEWASVIQNKLSILVVNDWLRRATTGTPSSAPSTGCRLFSVRHALQRVVAGDVTHATWTRDATVVFRCQNGDSFMVHIKDELEGYLLRYAAGGTAAAEAFPEGLPLPMHGHPVVDLSDDTLSPPADEEIANRATVAEYVKKRRRRRAYSRFEEFDLKRRGIETRQAFNVADLLDDGKIVLVEIPPVFGDEVQSTVATYVLMATLLRGLRVLSLPPRLRVPVSVYIDEAELFLAAGIEDTLAQLRKAQVAIVLAVQRLGQFGDESNAVRRAVMDTVGTTIALTPGRMEAAELSELLVVPKEDLVKLGRGHGVIAGLGADWSHDPAQAFSFEDLPPVEDDAGSAIREASIKRFYQTDAEADQVFADRVEHIKTADLLPVPPPPAVVPVGGKSGNGVAAKSPGGRQQLI